MLHVCRKFQCLASLVICMNELPSSMVKYVLNVYASEYHWSVVDYLLIKLVVQRLKKLRPSISAKKSSSKQDNLKL